MTERYVRKIHGTIGVVLSLFILVQVGTGTLIALDEFLGRGRHVHAEPSHHDGNHKDDYRNEQNDEEGFIQVIHHFGGWPVQALRFLLGLGVVFMVISGTRIYVLAHNRGKQGRNESSPGHMGPDSRIERGSNSTANISTS